ncbi:MAG: hypothetical protein JXQ29_17055 [Planctomycetes bacterium]|nr:hypothetical protein [Planctomycetota bacterium]
MFMRRLFLLLVVSAAFTLLASAGHAQPVGTDLLVSHSNGNLVRLAPSGTVTPIGNFSSSYLNMITMDTDNYHVIGLASGASGWQVVRIDPVAAAVRATVWSGSPFQYTLSWVDVDQDGDYVVSQNGSSSIAANFFKVKRDGSGAAIAFAGQTGQSFNAFSLDRTSGDWLLGDFTSKSIVRVDGNTGAVTRIIPLGTTGLQGMVQDPQQPEVYVASSTVVSYHPMTHAVTTVSTGLSSNSITSDRAPAPSGALIHLGLTSGMIQRVSRTGTNLGAVGNSGSNAFGVVFDRSRNLASELAKAPRQWNIRISFPGDAGRAYVLAFSYSGYTPGLPLPDGRVVPLVLDTLALLTARGAVPPFLTHNVGVLNASGSAVAVLDLNAIPVQGIRLWAAALSIDPAAPLGISQISAPILLVL